MDALTPYPYASEPLPDYALPISAQRTRNETEQAFNQLFADVFSQTLTQYPLLLSDGFCLSVGESVLGVEYRTGEDNLQAVLADVLSYGCPYLGSVAVLEKFAKLDGLPVIKRPDDDLLRVLYSQWIALASKRGLAFLEFMLQVLWPDKWQIKRLYHSIAFQAHYPHLLTDEVSEDAFLTSRIQVVIDDNGMTDADKLALIPLFRRLVPANVVPQMTIDSQVIGIAPMNWGVSVVMMGWTVGDYSVFS